MLITEFGLGHGTYLLKDDFAVRLVVQSPAVKWKLHCGTVLMTEALPPCYQKYQSGRNMGMRLFMHGYSHRGHLWRR